MEAPVETGVLILFRPEGPAPALLIEAERGLVRGIRRGLRTGGGNASLITASGAEKLEIALGSGAGDL